MKNGKLLMAVVGMVLLLAGFIIGNQQAQLRAAEKYVPKDQYNRDIAELKRGVGQLLQFHLEDRARVP